MKDEIEIKINPDWETDDSPVLYCLYPSQATPQPVYLYLSEDGEVWADRSGEIGYSVPVSVADLRTLRYGLPANITGRGIYEILTDERVLRLLQTVHDGHVVDWNGSRLTGRLDSAAWAADEGLMELIADILLAGDYLADMYNVDQYYEDDVLEDLLIGDTVEESAEILAGYAEEEGHYFADGVRTICDYLLGRIEEEGEGEER